MTVRAAHDALFNFALRLCDALCVTNVHRLFAADMIEVERKTQAEAGACVEMLATSVGYPPCF